MSTDILIFAILQIIDNLSNRPVITKVKAFGHG